MSSSNAPHGVVPIPSDMNVAREKSVVASQDEQLPSALDNFNQNSNKAVAISDAYISGGSHYSSTDEEANEQAAPLCVSVHMSSCCSTMPEVPLVKEEILIPAVKKGLEAIPSNVLDRKPSCVLTNVVSTCVNKAASHLELLQTLIEEWFVKKTQEKVFCQGHASAASNANRKRGVATFKTHEQPKPGMELSVQGIGSVAPQATRPDITDELPYLGGQEVIDETFALIARLEMDRQEAQRLLNAEQSRAQMLQKKTDNLAEKRARDYPIAVQKEHDDAVEDLNELQWHVTYKTRNEDKLKGRVEVSSVFNKRLNDDIAHVQKHCPLVEEKLSLELQAMQRIKEAQEDTSKELENTLDRLAKTKVRNEEAHTRAVEERKQMAQDIEDVRQELNDAITALADSRMLFTTHTHQTQETRQQITENVDEKKVLQVKAENSKMAESMQIKKVDDLTSRLQALELEHHKLEDECFTKQADYDVTVNTLESRSEELKRAVSHEENSLKIMTKGNEDLSIMIDDLTRKISKQEKAIEQDEKNLRRMNNQISNTEMMMNQMLDESSKVQAVNSVIRDKLQEERERVSQIEDALRQTLESLKKQCRDEIHTRGVLKSRITSDGTELVKSQAEAVQKKEKMSKTVVELETTLKVVVEKVDKLKSIHDSKKQILDSLEEEITETIKSKEKVESDYVLTREDLDPYLKKLQEEQVDLNQQIDKFENQMVMMERKREEMERTTKILQKSIRSQETAVEKLGKELSELTLQLESKTSFMNSLLGSRDDVLRRLENRSKEHQNLKKGRTEALEHHRVTLQSELALNRGYARTYRVLQGRHVDLKSQVMDMFDERNRLEAGIKDLKQLKGLQSRLRRALETYYKFRGLFNAGELERVLAESRISASKVTALQKNYHTAVTGIAKFLRSQMKAMNQRNTISKSVAVETINEEDI